MTSINDIQPGSIVRGPTLPEPVEVLAMPGHKVERFWKFKTEEVDRWVRGGEASVMGPALERKED